MYFIKAQWNRVKDDEKGNNREIEKKKNKNKEEED